MRWHAPSGMNSQAAYKPRTRLLAYADSHPTGLMMRPLKALEDPLRITLWAIIFNSSLCRVGRMAPSMSAWLVH